VSSQEPQLPQPPESGPKFAAPNFEVKSSGDSNWGKVIGIMAGLAAVVALILWATGAFSPSPKPAPAPAKVEAPAPDPPPPAADEPKPTGDDKAKKGAGKKNRNLKK